MAWSQEDAWFVLCLAMILVYTVLAAYCVYVFLLQICRSPPKDRVWQKSFSVFLTCGCALRILFWSLQPFIVRGMHVSLGVNFFLDTSPSFFFFSTYVILVIFWAEIYHSAHLVRRTVQIEPTFLIRGSDEGGGGGGGGGGRGSGLGGGMAGGASNSFRGLTRGASSGGGGMDAPIPSGTMGAPGAPPSKQSAPSIVRFRSVFFAINAVMYTVVAVCNFINIARNTGDAPGYGTAHPILVEIFMLEFSSLLYILAALAFFIYGFRLLRLLRRVGAKRRERRALTNRMGFLTFFVTIAFAFRAVLTAWAALTTSTDANWWFTGGYYVTLEVLPLLAIIYALNNVAPKTNAPGSASETSPILGR